MTPGISSFRESQFKILAHKVKCRNCPTKYISEDELIISSRQRNGDELGYPLKPGFLNAGTMYWELILCADNEPRQDK